MSEAITNAAIAAAVDSALDAALELRVALHRERIAGRLAVPPYLTGLRAIREVERVLEPLRESDSSRAYELALEERRA